MTTESRTVPTEMRRRVRRGNEEDAQQLRDDLLAAAMQLFKDGGLERVSMRSVAAKVGVSPMTPYRYFSDKAELLRGLWQDALQALYDELNAALTVCVDARSRQQAFFDAYLAFWETHPDYYWLVHDSQPTGKSRTAKTDDASAPVYAALLAMMRRTTEDLADAIDAERTWVKLAEDVTFAMLLGYLQAAFVNQRYPWTDRQLMRRAFVNQVLASKERCLLHGPDAPTCSL